jgi:hypothetical protein
MQISFHIARDPMIKVSHIIYNGQRSVEIVWLQIMAGYQQLFNCHLKSWPSRVVGEAISHDAV